MIRCPKCHSSNISGPSYCTGNLASCPKIKDCRSTTYSTNTTNALTEEHLDYICCTCGYAETQPCKDSQQNNTIQETIDRLLLDPNIRIEYGRLR